MKILLCMSFILLCCCVSEGKKISFLNYCLNGSNPEELPKHGAESAGTLVMSGSKVGSEPWYLPDLNCTVAFTTGHNFHILLTFSNVSLRNSSMDNLTIAYNSDKDSAVLAGQQVCSNENCEGLKFESGDFNNLTLKFISANITVPQNVTGFKGHYTVYDLADPETGACRDKHRFLCENKHCIWYGFVCDGHNDCGDLSDETKCIIPVRNTVWGIIVIVIAIIAVVVFVPLFIFLATYGTRSIVKSVTVPNQPTPLFNAGECVETSGLLTSSEAANNCWPGTSYERRNSFSYGSAEISEPSVSTEIKQKHRSKSEILESQENKFL